MPARFTLVTLDNRSRRAGAPSRPEGDATGRVAVLVTGIPSEGKRRLVLALSGRLRHLAPAIEVTIDGPPEGASIIRVHAESDLEGLVESPLFQARPHLVAPVDWESTERSVARVIDHLVAERLVPGEVR